jgi:hypothetical protein
MTKATPPTMAPSPEAGPHDMAGLLGMAAVVVLKNVRDLPGGKLLMA